MLLFHLIHFTPYCFYINTKFNIFFLLSYLQLQCHLYTINASICMHDLLLKTTLIGDSSQLLLIYKEYSYKLWLQNISKRWKHRCWPYGTFAYSDIHFFCFLYARNGSIAMYLSSVTTPLPQPRKQQWYIEDIYFFEVNTKYISSSVLKPSEFSWVRSTNENFDVFNSRDEICFVFTKKSKYSFYFIPFEKIYS